MTVVPPSHKPLRMQITPNPARRRTLRPMCIAKLHVFLHLAAKIPISEARTAPL